MIELATPREGHRPRLCYLLLSPTFGMHQYTADLANRMVLAGHEVHLVTTTTYRQDRYAPDIHVHTPVETDDTGLSLQALRLSAARQVVDAVCDLAPDVVHITGPHLWNLGIMLAVQRRGIPVIHTLHDLDPHVGSGYGALLHLWNKAVLTYADHILVHGARYTERLERGGLAQGKVSYVPLLHLFLGHEWLQRQEELTSDIRYEPLVLFFGRIEAYKGVDDLLQAWSLLNGHKTPEHRLVLAGAGDLSPQWAAELPLGVELRNRLIADAEAVDLFQRSSLLILPYRGATQSALVSAAYYFGKPVLATTSGALPEYVQDGVTGWLTEPGQPTALAERLEHALADADQLVRMGSAGRAWYEAERKTEEAVIRRMYATVIIQGATRTQRRAA